MMRAPRGRRGGAWVPVEDLASSALASKLDKIGRVWFDGIALTESRSGSAQSVAAEYGHTEGVM